MLLPGPSYVFQLFITGFCVIGRLIVVLGRWPVPLHTRLENVLGSGIASRLEGWEGWLGGRTWDGRS